LQDGILWHRLLQNLCTSFSSYKLLFSALSCPFIKFRTSKAACHLPIPAYTLEVWTWFPCMIKH
jgi:hypothetical protein